MDTAEECDSETRFSFNQEYPSSKQPTCVSGGRLDVLETIVAGERKKMSAHLFDRIPEFRENRNPHDFFMQEYCFAELRILTKAHQDLGIPFNYTRAIKNIVFHAPAIALSAFHFYQLYEQDNAKKNCC